MSALDKDNQPLADPEALQRHIEQALAVDRPSRLQAEINYRLIKRLFNPVVLGADNIPDEPCLFVGNHSLFALDGMILAPLFLSELDRFPRGMGDKFLFSNRRVADFALRNGVVMGHPEVGKALMQDRQDLLVFPGGALEAVKPARELYELQWKERLGFVRLAASNGYTIMPFGLVGPDEFYGHLLEGEDLPETLFARLLSSLGLLEGELRKDVMPPVPVGIMGTFFPKPQRCFLGFGKPIRLGRYRGKKLSRKSQQAIRERVSGQIEEQLAELLVTREQRRGEESLLRRLLTI